MLNQNDSIKQKREGLIGDIMTLKYKSGTAMNTDKKFGKRMDAKKLLEYTGIGKKDSKTHKHCPHPMKKKRGY